MNMHFRVLVAASILLQAAMVSSQTVSFISFISKHGRSYKPGTPEYERRRSLFEVRAAEAELHNSKDKRRWTAGVNHLSDWTPEELAKLNGWKGDKRSAVRESGSGLAHAQQAVSLQQTDRAKPLPASVHWGDLNASKTVHSQGGCGSCWAVAAATIMQAHSEIYLGSDWRTFAVQHMVDCVPNPNMCGGSGGCEGATVELALDWALHNQVKTEQEMPYQAADFTCKKDSKFLSLHQSDSQAARAMEHNGMKGWQKLPENKYEPLMRSVYEKGPVGVSVGASGWHSYASGIYDNCAQDIVVNHAVTLIGYGVEQSTGDKFWTILNSWGQDWGEGGQMRLLRSDDEEDYCGTDDDPAAGTGCRGGPEEVTVCGMCGILYDSALPKFAGSRKLAPQQSFLHMRGSVSK